MVLPIAEAWIRKNGLELMNEGFISKDFLCDVGRITSEKFEHFFVLGQNKCISRWSVTKLRYMIECILTGNFTQKEFQKFRQFLKFIINLGDIQGKVEIQPITEIGLIYIASSYTRTDLDLFQGIFCHITRKISRTNKNGYLSIKDASIILIRRLVTGGNLSSAFLEGFNDIFLRYPENHEPAYLRGTMTFPWESYFLKERKIRT